MPGYVFITQGDISRLRAHAVAYSTDSGLQAGMLTAAFEAHIPGFREGLSALQANPPPAGRHTGDTWWIDAAGTLPCGVVVTVAAAGGERLGDHAWIVTQRALDCAARELARRAVPKPWLIALPMFLTGFGGARRQRVAVAEPQVEVAERFVRESVDIDVVFVAFTETNYQVWLDARRRVRQRLGAGEPGSVVPSPALVAALQRGECVIFAGAGLSSRTGLPNWLELIDRLADGLAIPAESRRQDLDYLLDIAQWYRNSGTEPSIETLVGAFFTAHAAGATPTLSHYLLTALPAHYFITTNYDDLLELALTVLRRSPQRVVREEHVAATGARDGCYVVKLHGCASSQERLVLSRDDYDDYFRTHPAIALLLEGLLLNQSFLFVGYSLRDPDFRQVWSRIGSLLRGTKRPAFATTFDDPPELQSRQWADKGLDLLPIDGATVADKCRALDVFLDRLAEQVSRDPHLFLADDVSVGDASSFAQLRNQLHAVTPHLIDCARAALGSRSDALALMDLLRFFASHGWRGSFSGELSGVFVALSEHAELTADEKRELLAAALRFSESADEAGELAGRLEQLRVSPPPDRATDDG